MPVITRSQRKNNNTVASLKHTVVSLKSATQPINNVTHPEPTYFECAFLFKHQLKQLLHECELTTDISGKMQHSIQIFSLINHYLETLLCKYIQRTLTNIGLLWLKFAANVYNKTTELMAEQDAKRYDAIDAELVTTFANEYMKSRKFLSSYFKKLRISNPNMINVNEDPYHKLFKNIDEEDLKSLKPCRPRRNVPVVDYSGMA